MYSKSSTKYTICNKINMCVSSAFQLFGTIKISSVDDPDESEITDYNNFSNVFRALLVMAR